MFLRRASIFSIIVIMGLMGFPTQPVGEDETLSQTNWNSDELVFAADASQWVIQSAEINERPIWDQGLRGDGILVTKNQRTSQVHHRSEKIRGIHATKT